MQNTQTMKAIAVIRPGAKPEYVNTFPVPAAGEGQVMVRVKAVAVKHLDRLRASGKHYSTRDEPWTPQVVGSDGVGLLPDGRRVYGLGVGGTMAELALFDHGMMVPVPDELDDMRAAALPNGIMGAAMALRFRAKMQPGMTVLINGATGFTGAIAVQLAKHYGADNVLASGRNQAALLRLKSQGADEVIPLTDTDDAITNRLQELNRALKIDIVIDYLWGHPALLILDALRGNGQFSHPVSYVTVGSMAGDSIALSSAILRSTDIRIAGSGLGSWSKEEMRILFQNILPEAFHLAAAGRLITDVQPCPIEDVAPVWGLDFQGSKRLVVTV